jgi:transposase
MLCDSLGCPLKFIVTGGQVHDVTQAELLLDKQQGDYVIADKGYDSSMLVKYIEGRGFVPIIPARSNRRCPRPYDKELYRERNIIERTFNKLKQFRRIATRFEKTVINFMALLYLAAWTIWLR